jgi:hypothetical protein
MDLSQGGGGQGLLFKFLKERAHRSTEFGFDQGLHLYEAKRRGFVLQLSELPGNVWRDEVGPEAQDLSQFHKGRAQLLQGQASPFAAAALIFCPPGGSPKEGRPNPQDTDELTEPVLGEDCADPA